MIYKRTCATWPGADEKRTSRLLLTKKPFNHYPYRCTLVTCVRIRQSHFTSVFLYILVSIINSINDKLNLTLQTHKYQTK